MRQSPGLQVQHAEALCELRLDGAGAATCCAQQVHSCAVDVAFILPMLCTSSTGTPPLPNLPCSAQAMSGVLRSSALKWACHLPAHINGCSHTCKLYTLLTMQDLEACQLLGEMWGTLSTQEEHALHLPTKGWLPSHQTEEGWLPLRQTLEQTDRRSGSCSWAPVPVTLPPDT